MDTKYKKRNIKLYGEFKNFDVICHKCNKTIVVNEREKLFPSKIKYYCNRSCANSRQNTIESNGRRSSSLKKFYPPFERNCPQCNKILVFASHKFLSRSVLHNSLCRECLIKNRKESGFYKKFGSIGGKLSAKTQSEIRRSKNEMEFADLCKSKFINVLTNEAIFNGWDADVILQNEKVAVLWNGKWHREKITKKHSVLQVQNRDRIKIDEIRKLGYTPYIIDDNGRHNSKLVSEEFNKFVKFVSEKV